MLETLCIMIACHVIGDDMYKYYLLMILFAEKENLMFIAVLLGHIAKFAVHMASCYRCSMVCLSVCLGVCWTRLRALQNG